MKIEKDKKITKIFLKNRERGKKKQRKKNKKKILSK